MPRPRYAVMALLAAALLSGCGTPANRSTTPDTAAVVEQAPEPSAPPEPTCAPADTTSTTPPEPDQSGTYRDGSTYDC